MIDGWYPAQRSQQESMKAREELIKSCLDELKSAGVTVKNVTSLSKLVKAFVAEAEGSPCSHETFLSNRTYRELLDGFITPTKETLVRKSRQRTPTSDGASDASKMLDELKHSNLQTKYTRLKAYVANLEKQLDASSAGGLLAVPFDASGGSMKFEQAHKKFVRTCQALNLLLMNLEGIVKWDPLTKTIYDPDPIADPVIVPAEYATDFFDWMSSNGAN
ncbi:hypothetical protein GJ699_00145 [Duganella sp. FT80W]|uniref:Uncharacterized protein n=1 Tax=Duganella guangzhouensis TaxID=2666084 RepID=A0A6I2KS30_9BURK|nr:hypothetical protein [Duganella guangzhouensis]MRW88393.1 hypothetical protein [Duganella guangzhouensis]